MRLLARAARPVGRSVAVRPPTVALGLARHGRLGVEPHPAFFASAPEFSKSAAYLRDDTAVTFPEFSPTTDEGTLQEWLKEEGAHVAQGDTLAVIDGDKVAVDLQAPRNGYLTALAPAGRTYKVGQTVCQIVNSPPGVRHHGMMRFFSTGQQENENKIYGRLVVKEGQRAVIWQRDGTARPVTGPHSEFIWGLKVESLRKWVADSISFLVVERQDGTQENLRGPAEVWFDPLVHRSIKIRRMHMLDANEAMVVYLRDAEVITRRIVRGPTVIMPLTNEWVHEFKWKQESALHANTGRPFNIVKCLPDQLELLVKGRTQDNADITVNLFLLVRLVDVDKMIEASHDPLFDLRTALIADVITFVAKCTLAELKDKCQQLNGLEAYTQTLARARDVGYEVSKATYRGLTFSSSLNDLMGKRLVTETELKVKEQHASQQQHILDIESASTMDRNLAVTKADATLRELNRKQNNLDFTQQREQTIQQNKDQLSHLEALSKLGVDLTALLVAQHQRVDNDVRITTQQPQTPQLHLHMDKKKA